MAESYWHKCLLCDHEIDINPIEDKLVKLSDHLEEEHFTTLWKYAQACAVGLGDHQCQWCKQQLRLNESMVPLFNHVRKSHGTSIWRYLPVYGKMFNM